MKFTFFALLPVKLILILALFSFLAIPLVTIAAVEKPTCALILYTKQGITKTSGHTEVLLPKDDEIKIIWISLNSDLVKDTNGKVVPSFGITTKTPETKTTYKYTFSADGESTVCSVTVYRVAGSIDEESLTTGSTKPKLYGEAADSKSVLVKIFEPDDSDPVYESKAIKVVNDKWEVKLTKRLPDGIYKVVLSDDRNLSLNVIDTGTLAVGKVSLPKGTVVVARIALLSGGTARAMSAVPLSYLQFINVSNETVVVKGITLKQNGPDGTAPIVGLKIVDDLNIVRADVDVGDEVEFKSGAVTIPINVTLESKEMRLFTVKAIMADNLNNYLGDQLKIDVTGINSTANVKSTFPIRGVTWTIGL